MKNEEILYPQYRKYSHGKTYFKVLSATEFEELQIIGGNCTLHHIVARILPDRNYIHDLTINYQQHWEKITEKEYEEKLKKRCI